MRHSGTSAEPRMKRMTPTAKDISRTPCAFAGEIVRLSHSPFETTASRSPQGEEKKAPPLRGLLRVRRKKHLTLRSGAQHHVSKGSPLRGQPGHHDAVEDIGLLDIGEVAGGGDNPRAAPGRASGRAAGPGARRAPAPPPGPTPPTPPSPLP